MTRWIEPKVDLGNVLTVLGVVAALVANWAIIGADVQQLKEDAKSLHDSDAQFELRLSTFKDKMSDMQLEQTRTLGDIRADIRSIREALERLNPAPNTRQAP